MKCGPVQPARIMVGEPGKEPEEKKGDDHPIHPISEKYHLLLPSQML